jgi:hypothetical protein
MFPLSSPLEHRGECSRVISRLSRVPGVGRSASVAPGGGFGGSTGIADVQNLAWELAATVEVIFPRPS